MQFMRPFTTRVINPLTRRFADRLPGFAIISYRGRTSGRTYHTPMNVFRDGDSYVFALTYGPDVQWVKNVLAAGEAEIRTHEGTILLTEPELFSDPQGRAMPRVVRIFLRFQHVTAYLRMRPVDQRPTPAGAVRRSP